MVTTRSSGAMTGGQWNFSGVLYQLLATLRSGLNATVEEVANGGAVAGVRIVVEPAKGGDTRVHQAGRCRVDQIKIRRGAAPWTTRTIIEDVLPDLFKAVGDAPASSEFRFVTDNLEGTTAFTEFLVTVRALDTEGKGPQDLDTLERPFRWGTERISAEDLFTRIAEILRQPETEIWRFLTAVEVVGWSEAVVSSEIDEMLGALVTEREDIPIKRKALTAHLLGLGRVGGSISAEGLLRAVDLNPARMTHAQRLPAVMREQVEVAARQAKYDWKMDVRATAVLPDAPLSILSGDSGQGKTWRLYRAALAKVEAGGCALFLPARGRLADIETKIVDLIWRTDFDRSLPLAQVAERMRPKLADDDGVWVTVFLDDLADPKLAAELADGSWARIGVKVVVSAQNRIARMLTQANEDVREVVVPDFTLAELRDYLRRAGRDPNQVPDDVLLSLLRPVLAAIYCKIPGSARWAAVSEYELMDRYWRWSTSEHRSQALHTSDSYVILGLAGSLLDGAAIYPWTPSVTHGLAVTDAARDRLITVGILREDSHGALQVSHDRVLNWAVASEIERRFLEGKLAVNGIADLLGQLDNISTPRGDRLGRRLGYVLHDLLWKLARSAKPDEVGTLSSLTIRSGVASGEHEHFFKEGLGSLGAPIIPALSWMARQAYSEEEWLVPRYLATAFIAVAEGAEPQVAAAARILVDEDQEQSRSIGLNVLRRVPAADAVELLWSINKDRNAAMIAAKDGRGTYPNLRSAKEQSFDALACAVHLTPDWLRAKATSVIDAEDAEQLLWLLMQLDIRVAKPIWAATKGNLLAHASPMAIVVPRAIRYFRDRDELERIDAALESPEPYGAALWFDALAYLAPETALQRLDRLTSRELWGTSHWWLQGLLFRAGPTVHARLLETVGEEQEDGQATRRELAILYGGEQDLLDPATFDHLIDSFEACLEREERGETVQPGAHGHLRALIASAASPVLLERLAARAGSRFEQLLTRAAISREGRSSMLLDHDGAEYHLILGAIGGDGFDQLVIAELDRPNRHARTDGVTAAAWTHSPVVKSKLEAIAEEQDGDTYRQVQLMNALAVHRGDAGLRAMVRGGSPVFLRAVEIRENGPPWADEHLAEIETLLRSAETETRELGINLCGFIGGEMAGSMLAPILESTASTDQEVDHARGVLAHLAHYRPTYLPRLKGRLSYDDAGLSTAHYLASSGDVAARAAVVDWLAQHQLTRLRSSELPIAFWLLQHSDSAEGGRAFLKRVWKSKLGFGREGEILAALAEAGDSEANAALDAIAYQKPRRGNGSVVAAIRALRSTSPAEALAAAERFYHQTRAEAAAHLLLQFDAVAGSKILLEDYPFAPIPIRHQIGRLLRRAAPQTHILEALNSMSVSEVSQDRLAAAELAGWLPFEAPVAFLDSFVGDEAEVVEKAALVALRQRQADAECARLIERLPAQPRSRQWSWLHALVDRGDPAHLADPKDPRSIHDLLDQLGDDFREEANTLLKKRAKKLKERADKLEKDRQR